MLASMIFRGGSKCIGKRTVGMEIEAMDEVEPTRALKRSGFLRTV
jgi:hypothetical protein